MSGYTDPVNLETPVELTMADPADTLAGLLSEKNDPFVPCTSRSNDRILPAPALNSQHICSLSVAIRGHPTPNRNLTGCTVTQR